MKMHEPMACRPSRARNGITQAMLAGALLALAGVTPTEAAEGIRLPGPVGGADIRSALLPEPGLYAFAGITLPDNTQYYGHDGAVSAKGTSSGLAGAVLAVYPSEVLGGRIGSMILGSYAHVKAEIPGVLPASQDSGFGDIYFEPVFWSRLFPFGGPAQPVTGNGPPIPYGLAVGLTAGVTFPTGHYDVDKPVNVGLNHYVLSPSIALTYTFPSLINYGQAMELSARLYYNYQYKNSDNNYLSGDLVNVDFAATMRNGPLQVGLAGSYAKQVKDDTLDGEVVGDGNRAMFLQLGPVATLGFKVGEQPWEVGFKALFDIDGDNTLANNIYTLRVGTKFF
jgi:hypothetical protein